MKIVIPPDCDTVLDGLPELTTRRNPNLSILKLFYGSDTMLRENEYIDSD